MWFASLAQLLLLTVPTAEPARPGALAPPIGMPKPLATRQTLFAIPFQIRRNDDPRREATEVQLYVSPNRGARWDLYSRVPPSQEKFLFRTGADGEYWFLIRTVDRSGQVHPQHNNHPGLIVVVDTAPPALRLEAQRGDAGQIIAHWQVAEPHLKPDSLQIQYRIPPSQTWQTVAVDRRSVRVSGSTLSGEVAWWPKAGAGRVEIRAEASDLAGNVAVTHAQVDLDADPVVSSPTPAPILRGPSNAPPNASTSGWRSVQPSSPAASSVSSSVNPPIRNQFVAALPPTPAPSDANRLAGSTKPRIVATPRFELDYEIEAPDPRAPRRVELWGTLDGGRTWAYFGTDNDGRSPMQVKVDREGLYGFRVLVQDGHPSRPPQPGERPQVWIGVDQTRPTARILSVEPGTGDRAGQLIVRWQAEDWTLTSQPITLLFSESPDGPWMTIASKMANLGQHAWRLDSRIPSRLYLRLEARDEAGNVGVYVTPKPIELEPPSSNVRIRDVRPISQSARTAPKRYYFR